MSQYWADELVGGTYSESMNVKAFLNCKMLCGLEESVGNFMQGSWVIQGEDSGQ